ncbi:hypothetical protein Dsin_005550 [Dipteronia sinensis]|uniref:Transposase n=1 Tax=Dipteronia sinensis TaxID=43782 RepID=A0AAE0AWR2_9ROSI|nr:hypothetical protein Dsin_005550 [Dipteronia sinensis]
MNVEPQPVNGGEVNVFTVGSERDTMAGFLVHCDSHWIVSGNNQPFGSVPSLGFTSAENVQGTSASTNKHAEDVVDDFDSSETSNTDDQTCSNGQAPTCCKEASTDIPINSTPSTKTLWTIPGSELYSIQPIRSKDLFEDNGHLGQIYKGQMFKDKKTLKGALGMHALTQRFEYKVRRSNHTRSVATCKKRDCQWVFRAGKSRNGTDWHVTSIDNEHTCRVSCHRVSCHVIGELFSRKFADPGRNIRPTDIICDVRDKHCINLSYNKAYRSKDSTLHSVFGDPWESFNMLPAYFHMLVKSNLGTVAKIETDRKNRFKYGFMALGACIEGFNTVIRPVITVDATHLKSKTRGVLLVTVCKDGNEMIYPLVFGFTNSENIKSWTWFLTQLRGVILHPKLVMIVSDRHIGISNGMRAKFVDAAHGVCAYHLAKNLKQHCRKRGDVINLYYRATYVYRVEEFDHLMVELKAMHPKVYDELLEVGIHRFSRVHSLRKRFKGMPINALCSDFFTAGWPKQAYAMAVNPVPKPEAWDITDDVHNRVVLSWKKKQLIGRPKKNRTPYVGEKQNNKRNQLGMKTDEPNWVESIFECLRQMIANVEDTIREERANDGCLTGRQCSFDGES